METYLSKIIKKQDMEIKISENQLELKKPLNSLDKFTIKFVNILNKHNIKNVLISGYVAIVFGRNRGSEDIDIFIEELDMQKIKILWEALIKDFYAINVSSPEEMLESLKEELSVRFSKKGEFIPNMEVKFVKSFIDKETMNNRQKLILNDNDLYISPLELQIAFKLTLASEKDIEDARFLFNLFNEHLDKDKLNYYIKEFKVEKGARYLC